MQGYEQQHIGSGPQLGPQAQLQAGVSQFMTGVYAWMTAGVAVSALVAYGISAVAPVFEFIYGINPVTFEQTGSGTLATVLLFSPLVLAWILPGRIPNMAPGMAVSTFLVFAAILGSSLATIPLVAANSPEFMGVVVKAFVTTVGIFGSMAVFGYVTKKDLSGMGQFLFMALVGAVIASVVNFWMASTGMSLIISVIVAIAAAGLTAYQTQAIKQMYLVRGGRGNLAILGALILYVSFVNLFLSLLRLFGGRD
jgi:FtsH-binding integral membrane protein